MSSLAYKADKVSRHSVHGLGQSFIRECVIICLVSGDLQLFTDDFNNAESFEILFWGLTNSPFVLFLSLSASQCPW